MSSFSTRLKAARDALDLTQAELAAKSGVPRNSIAKYETDPGIQPRKDRIERLERALGKPPGWLLYGERSLGGRKEIEDAAVAMRTLPDEKLRVVLEMIKVLSA